MLALDNVRIGMAAEMTVTVTPEMTVGHFVAEHAAGLCHADHDPAYGNGVRFCHCFAIFQTALSASAWT